MLELFLSHPISSNAAATIRCASVESHANVMNEQTKPFSHSLASVDVSDYQSGQQLRGFWCHTSALFTMMIGLFTFFIARYINDKDTKTKGIDLILCRHCSAV